MYYFQMKIFFPSSNRTINPTMDYVDVNSRG